MGFSGRRSFSVLLSVVVVLATSIATADTTYLVQDLGPRVMEEWVDGRPPVHAVADGVAYFYRSDGLHGRELWRSDGTALGTYMIRDVCPGLCGSESFAEPDTIAAVGSLVYFGGHDGVHGSELWVTDGTATGTRMVADLRPGPLSSLPYDFAPAAGLLYFTADDGVRGRELARSDGTAAGTYVVDLEPGPGSSAILLIEPSPSGLFLYRGGPSGGLWRSDGTAAGTELVYPGIEIPVLGWWKTVAFRTLPNGVLVFQGCSQSNPTDDCEPWRSDGTTLGTYRLADLFPGSGSSQPAGFVGMGDEIWFTAYQGSTINRPLFRTDGTVAGTAPIPTPSGLFLGSSGEAHDGRLFLAGSDDAVGVELWVSDGAGVQLVADLRPGPDGALAPIPFQTPYLASVGGSLVFLADDGAGIGLWRTDGTAAGTERLTDLGLAPGDLYRFDDQASVPAIRAGGRVVLPLWKDDVGLEIWTSDASSSGTQPILTTATQRSAFSEPVRWLFTVPPTRCAAPLRHGVVVAAQDEATFSTGSFRYLDGVPAGAARLGAAFDDMTRHPECAANGGEVLALGGPSGGTGVLRTRGHANDAALVLPIVGMEIASDPFFERFGDRVAFSVEDLLYLAPEGGDLGAYSTWDTEEISGSLRAADQRLFFGGGHQGLAALEGETYTILVASPTTGPLDDLTTSAGRAYFSLATAADGAELWTSDGTTAGTRLVRELRPGAASPFPPREIWEQFNLPLESRVAGLGDGRAVFAADDGAHGTEVWVTDGTEPGTTLLADLVPGPDGSWPRHLTSFGASVFFTAEDPKHGLELWRTDGTPAGTGRVKDLVVGPGSSVPEELSVQDGLLYFSAWTPAHGREAWRSDGTAAGTYRITDIVPGARSSNPNRFTRSGELLFFVANDEVHGREVWAIAPDGSFPLFLDGFESGDAGRWSSSVP